MLLYSEIIQELLKEQDQVKKELIKLEEPLLFQPINTVHSKQAFLSGYYAACSDLIDLIFQKDKTSK